MEEFYCQTMGFYVTDRGTLNTSEIVFLSRDPDEHHQIVLVARRQALETPALFNQISFRVRSLTILIRFFERIQACNLPDIDPVIHGNAWSVYFSDPEGNRIEVFADTEWYIPQPIKEKLDFSLSEDEIRKITHAFCVMQPGFKPRDQWRAEMARKMGEGTDRLTETGDRRPP
jgi:catechol-2,3-dioxygenase